MNQNTEEPSAENVHEWSIDNLPNRLTIFRVVRPTCCGGTVF